MLERIQNINTINIRQPKEYQKFEYDVEIDGQKQNASIEKFPNGKVKINLGDGKNNKTIITDEKGLIEFNKKHQKQDKIFNSQEEKKQSDTEEKLRLGGNAEKSGFRCGGRRFVQADQDPGGGRGPLFPAP